jgi:hypothetical protein
MIHNDSQLIDFFTSPYRGKSLEIRHKAKYLLYVNLVGLVFFILLLFVHIVELQGVYSIIGQVLSFSLLLLSTLLIRFKKVMTAGNLTALSILGYNFFTFIINDYFYMEVIPAMRMYESLSFLLIGNLILGLYAIKKIQVYLYSFMSFILLTVELFIVFEKIDVPLTFSGQWSLVMCFIFFMAASHLSYLILTKHKGLIVKADKKYQDTQIKYKKLFSSLADGFAYLKVVYNSKRQPVDARFIEANIAFFKVFNINNEVLLKKRISKAPDQVKVLFGDPITFLSKFSDNNYFKYEITDDQGKSYQVQAYEPSRGYIMILIRAL